MLSRGASARASGGVVLALWQVILSNGIEAEVYYAANQEEGNGHGFFEKNPDLRDFWDTLEAGVGELEGLFRRLASEKGVESSLECSAEAADDGRNGKRLRLERSPNWNGNRKLEGGNEKPEDGKNGKRGQNRGCNFCESIAFGSSANSSGGWPMLQTTRHVCWHSVFYSDFLA